MKAQALTFDADAFLARYDALDAALVAAGFPATSPWWRAQLERFLRSGRRRWVLRVGRRGGKSSTLCRLAVAWALWGAWSVPPGDVAVVPFVSVDRSEAKARLKTISEILRVLGIEADERGEELELRGRALVFGVRTCSIRGTVGFTSIMVLADEMARWESRDTMANPAGEVMGSLRPTMATQPNAFEVCSSSPWGTDDYHAQLFDAGDTRHQVASFAETWVANPTITEEQTHELEPDERVWSREYAAVPGATLSAAIDSADVLGCYDRIPTGKFTSAFLAIDASSLRGDSFAWLAGKVTDCNETVVSEVDGWDGAALQGVDMRHIVTTIAARAHSWGTAVVFADQREEASLRSMFHDHRIELRVFTWTEQSKDEAMQWLRREMREGRVCIHDEHPKLRHELLNMKARLLPSGRIRYETSGLDYASSLVTLAHAAVNHELFAPSPERVTIVPRGRRAGMNSWER